MKFDSILIQRKVRVLKSSIKLLVSLKNFKKYRLESGFSMLEAVVVVGVLLALAVAGFISYGPITQNAKIAKVKSAASDVYTAVTVAQIDGDSNTSALGVIDDYNASNQEIRTEIRESGVAYNPESSSTNYEPKSDHDFCVRAIKINDESIFAENGNCGNEALNGPSGTPTASPAGYVDPNPTQTILTYRCDDTTTGWLPWQTNLNGKETWDDGSSATTYTNADYSNDKTLTAGITYKVVFDGTYQKFTSDSNLRKCLISMDHWGSNTGVTSAYSGFWYAYKLTTVPDHIPSTIVNMTGLFYGASNFNQNINSWDVSNVRNMSAAFSAATKFNQPLDKWNISNVEQTSDMFNGATAFNQPLNSWNVSKVWHSGWMFKNATSFNQPLDKWNFTKIRFMDYMFNNASSFSQDISSWNVASIESHADFSTGSPLTSSQIPRFTR